MPRELSEYYDPREGANAHHTHVARLDFFECIAHTAPEVLTALRDDVLPTVDAPSLWPPPLTSPWPLVGLNAEAVPNDTDATLGMMAYWPWPPDAPPRRALESWARRYHLGDAWLLSCALFTLLHWVLYPDQHLASSPLVFQMTGWLERTLEVDVPPCEPYRPTQESLRNFALRVEGWTRMNIEAAAQLAAARGLRRTPRKNASRRAAAQNLHYEWLVRWQCQEWTEEGIAKKYQREYDAIKRTSRTVRRALTQTAQLIGLTLRRP